MKWLVTGASGQLGVEIVELLDSMRPNDVVFAPSRLELDVSRSSDAREAIRRFQPDVLVNCAAWTDVDAAESQEPMAHTLNAVAPEVMSATLASLGHGYLVQVSTDYVFGGESESAYSENSPTSPKSAYGRTKAAGEMAVRINLPDRSAVVRTAWLYGRHGNNFPKAILRQLQAGVPVSVVDDQFGHPTYAQDVAARVLSLALAIHGGLMNPGIYHAVNSGVTSWWEFARELADQAGYGNTEIRRIRSEELMRPALRPSRVALEDGAATRLGLRPMRPWTCAVAAALPRLDPAGA